MAIKLFVHGVKFYFKILSNFIIIFDSIKIYEMNFAKTSHFEYLYESLFKFFYDAINIVEKPSSRQTLTSNLTSKSTKVETSQKKSSTKSDEVSKLGIIITKMEMNSEDPIEAKHIYLRKFYMALVLHYACVCYNNDFTKEKKLIDENVTKLNLAFSKKSLDSCMDTKNICKHDLKDLESSTIHIKLFNLIIKYIAQFKKKVAGTVVTPSSPKSKATSTSSTTLTIEQVLKENMQIELQLKKEFEKIYGYLLETQSFYQFWLSNNLFDLFYSVITNGLFDQAGFSKYLQESLIECFAAVSFLYSENIQVKTKNDPLIQYGVENRLLRLFYDFA